MQEVKNVAYLSNTRQMRDFIAISNTQRAPLEIYVRENTRISGPLLNAVGQGRDIEIIRGLPPR